MMSKSSLISCLILVLVMGSPLVHGQQKPNSDESKAAQSDFLGSWVGSLNVGAVRLRLVFHIQSTDGTLAVKLDSPDQGAKGIPLDQIVIAGSKITIGSKKMNATYEGTMESTKKRIDGQWMQSGQKFKLDLDRSAGSVERNRPQTPRAPFPYRVEEVTFRHHSADFQMAGTLTLPKEEGRYPAAILITGSGAQDRDETIFEHKPFAVLADHLTKAGIAVLRVDDRGVGGTGVDGNPTDDTTQDFVTDVESSLRYLRSRNDIDAKRIGLVGHSEGAIIAASVAAADKDVAWVVLLAGPGVPGDELILYQAEKIARASGAGEQEIENNKRIQREIYKVIRNQPDAVAARKAAKELLLKEYEELEKKDSRPAQTAEEFANQHSAAVAIPWFRYFITLDPRESLAQLSCPVLVLTGEKDLQVPPEQNHPQIEKALSKSSSKDVTIKSLPMLNHLFQTAKTGLVSEYGEIEETFSPEALKVLSAWLDARVRIRDSATKD